MVQKCCVKDCEVTAKDEITFKFPNSRTLQKKWLDILKLGGKVNVSELIICVQHFLESDYKHVRGKTRLNGKVVPSVFSTKLIAPDVKTPEPTIPKPSHDAQESSRLDKCITTPESGIITPAQVCAVVNKDGECSDIVVNVDGINEYAQDVHSNIDSEPDLNKDDIEEIITNYHIKQTKPIPLDEDPFGLKDQQKNRLEVEFQPNPDCERNKENDPVFIEVSVGQNRPDDANNGDCLMLLESVQVEVDPATLMLQEHYDDDDDDDVVVLPEKKEDPISLVTSSDEDDVIIQEPHIDTVSVSDETDEDDVPLMKLLKNKPKKRNKTKNPMKNDLAELMWGIYNDYYCIDCHFRTTDKAEFKLHKAEHSTVLQICPLCSYTTASKAQFYRHKKKHKDDRKFQCHLCDYKARHKMSLIYHLENHDGAKIVSLKKCFKCKKCGYKTNVKFNLLKHINECNTKKKYKCSQCDYATNRSSDSKRHFVNKHSKGD